MALWNEPRSRSDAWARAARRGGRGRVVFGIGAGAHWLKGKAESFVNAEERIEDLKAKANRPPFTRPADGVITEARLLKFLDVRQRVFSVYERHKAQLEAMKDKKEATWAISDGALRLSATCASPRPGHGGRGHERRGIPVPGAGGYHSAWAAAIEKDTGKPASEAMGELMKKAGEAVQRGVEAARDEGRPRAPGTFPTRP